MIMDSIIEILKDPMFAPIIICSVLAIFIGDTKWREYR